jgi:hypothetical protein
MSYELELLAISYELELLAISYELEGSGSRLVQLQLNDVH